jgi:hypothetical protein
MTISKNLSGPAVDWRNIGHDFAADAARADVIQ